MAIRKIWPTCRIFQQHRNGEPVEALQPVLQPKDVLALQEYTRSVTVAEPMAEYILDLVHATRHHEEVTLGASTRAGLMFYRAAQANARLDGRDHVTPEDVKAVAVSGVVDDPSRVIGAGNIARLRAAGTFKLPGGDCGVHVATGDGSRQSQNGSQLSERAPQRGVGCGTEGFVSQTRY